MKAHGDYAIGDDIGYPMATEFTFIRIFFSHYMNSTRATNCIENIDNFIPIMEDIRTVNRRFCNYRHCDRNPTREITLCSLKWTSFIIDYKLCYLIFVLHSRDLHQEVKLVGERCQIDIRYQEVGFIYRNTRAYIYFTKCRTQQVLLA